jgi:hypothetical protein
MKRSENELAIILAYVGDITILDTYEELPKTIYCLNEEFVNCDGRLEK